ncbi:MAG: hypothetical protein PHT69_03945 [Bacteroidales bacterium]|nr:hypothetical protein [Bacteroidales bacterium]
MRYFFAYDKSIRQNNGNMGVENNGKLLVTLKWTSQESSFT